jgi:hypothetical protein
MVEKYKKDYAEEYGKFLDLIEYRRSIAKDKRYANLQGTTEIRNAVSIPDRLFNMFAYVMKGIDEPRFLEEKGEMKWFIKKFPEFLIPKSY